MNSRAFRWCRIIINPKQFSKLPCFIVSLTTAYPNGGARIASQLPDSACTAWLDGPGRSGCRRSNRLTSTIVRDLVFDLRFAIAVVGITFHAIFFHALVFLSLLAFLLLRRNFLATVLFGAIAGSWNSSANALPLACKRNTTYQPCAYVRWSSSQPRAKQEQSQSPSSP